MQTTRQTTIKQNNTQLITYSKIWVILAMAISVLFNYFISLSFLDNCVQHVPSILVTAVLDRWTEWGCLSSSLGRCANSGPEQGQSRRVAVKSSMLPYGGPLAKTMISGQPLYLNCENEIKYQELYEIIICYFHVYILSNSNNINKSFHNYRK